MNNKITRLLIVGLGSIGKRHLKIANELLPNAKIAVLRHVSCNELPDLKIDSCFTNTEDALNFKPEAAIIANPASHHIEIAMLLANAGIHLLIEKPIAHNLHGVAELVELCQKRKLTLMVGYNLRFSPSLIIFKDCINNKVGEKFSIRTEVGQNLISWRPGSDYRNTVSAQKKLGGGVLLELSHEIDYLQWLFGTVVWVKSHVSRQGNLEIDVEDTANFLLGFKKNKNAKEIVANVTLDFIRHDATRQCLVVGEEGTLRWDGIKGDVDFFPANGDSWEMIFSENPERDLTYKEELKNFILCVHDGNKPLVTGEDGLYALTIIEAINKSSDIGKVVYLEKNMKVVQT